MPGSSSKWLVETDWLADRLMSPGMVIVDASMGPPLNAEPGLSLYQNTHIPGAVHFDVDEICDTHSLLPHMVPPPEKFASRMRKMGIGDGIKVIVYDNKGMVSAPRVWWMFRVMGHEDVAVLNGGLPKWLRERRPVEAGSPVARLEKHFTARKNAALVRSLADMKLLVASQTTQIADARAKGRFEGREPELRPVPRLGAMPGAKNLPFGALFAEDGTMLAPEQLKAAFLTVGIDPTKPVVTTCGSGVTACVLAFGLALTGNEHAAVYDGSWAEWSQDPEAPVVSQV